MNGKCVELLHKKHIQRRRCHDMAINSAIPGRSERSEENRRKRGQDLDSGATMVWGGEGGACRTAPVDTRIQSS